MIRESPQNGEKITPILAFVTINFLPYFQEGIILESLGSITEKKTKHLRT